MKKIKCRVTMMSGVDKDTWNNTHCPDQLARQNRNRPEAVPDAVISHLARKLEPPQHWEAHRVVWVK